MIITILVAGTLLFWLLDSWPAIASWVQEDVLPWMREFSPEAAEFTGELFLILNGKICWATRQVEKLYNYFCKTTRIEDTYTKVGPNEVVRERAAITRDIEAGIGKKRVEKTTLTWDQLPSEIQREMIMNNTNEAKMEIGRKVVAEKIRQKCKEQNIPLTEMELAE